MLQSETVSAQDKMADDNEYDTVKTNHCPMFDERHVSFQELWLWFEIYVITNGFDDAITKDSPGQFAGNIK